MFGYYFGQATISALLGTIAYVASLMTTIQLVGDDAARGINGLQIFAVMMFPFVIIFTLPITLILAKIIKDNKKIPQVLYILVIVLGIILGIFNGLASST